MAKGWKRIGPTLAALALAGHWIFSTLQLRATVPASGLDAWVLDVGQGESVLVREPSGKKLLFDGGPDDSILAELGAILPPWDRRIDLAILSHNHSDHIRGLIAALDRYEIGEVWISGAIHTTEDYRAFLEALGRRRRPPTVVRYDADTCSTQCPAPVQFGETQLQVYHPLKNMTGVRPEDQHDAGVIVKVSQNGRSLLLTGDIDESHERELLRTCKPPACSLAATALQIPHHGSASGLSPEFLKAVSPALALIPVGLDNKFDHPRAPILEKLSAAGVPVYRTDTQGRIHLRLDESGYSVTTSHQ